MDLQHYKTFNEETTQGVVGLLRPLTLSSLRLEEGLNRENNKKVLRLDQTIFPVSATDYFFVEDEPARPIFVFKIPKEVNTLVDHEYKVAKDMEELSIYLPHFNRIFEVKRNIKCYIPENYKKNNNKVEYNPFDQYNCVRDVSIIEYIPSKLTLLKYIKETNFLGCTEPLLHQLILGLFIAQQEKQFTHYDLHLENVLLRRCYKRTFFWYKFLYEGVVIQRLVHTNGYFPVLFDYGFAYSKGLESTSYNNSLFFTNKGYTPFMFDEINDFKTLMVRLAYIRNCPQKFKEIANTKFLKSTELKIKFDRETGWIKTTLSSAARVVCKRLEKSIIKVDPNYKDNFIHKELDDIVELFGILIKLPIAKCTFQMKTLDNVVESFLKEWKKIDGWFRSTVTDDKLNILKRTFETINELITEGEVDVNHKFKLKMFEIFDAFGDFINVEDLDYGRFLSSIIEISNFIEYIVYAEIQRGKKVLNYNMDSWTLMTEFEDLVEPKEPYQFQTSDSIVLFDCMEKSTSSFELKDNDVIGALNICSSINAQIDLFSSLDWHNFCEEE